MSRKWTDDESRWLRDNYARMDILSLSQRLAIPIAEVEKRLKQLKLSPSDAAPAPSKKSPATLKEAVREISLARKEYEKAMEAFHRRDLGDAARRFEALIEKHADAREFVDRARMYLAACRAGGKKASPVPSSPEELYHAAVFEKNRGQVSRALDLVRKGAHAKGDEARFAYLAACCHALAGQYDEALTSLRKAVAADPMNRVHARLEADLSPLRGTPLFSEIVAG